MNEIETQIFGNFLRFEKKELDASPSVYLAQDLLCKVYGAIKTLGETLFYNSTSILANISRLYTNNTKHIKKYQQEGVEGSALPFYESAFWPRKLKTAHYYHPSAQNLTQHPYYPATLNKKQWIDFKLTLDILKLK